MTEHLQPTESQALLSVRLGLILAKLVSDEEMEYALYRRRSTEASRAEYATLALSAACTLSKDEYELLQEILEQQEPA